ncbi:response regulator transcription factor [Aestuariimicrobium soli]|uniref:response regulator transcription factor n=1 Tax=Aestuariimicrobium soli TaxID=2035834 RepID=UPI003EBDB16B
MPETTSPRERARPIRIALINDYPLVVEGLRAMLAPFRDRVEVVELDTRTTAVATQVDIALYDSFGRGTTALSPATRVADDEQVPKAVLYTWVEDEWLPAEAARLGLHGVISKTVCGDDLVRAIELVHSGRPYFSSPSPEGPHDVSPSTSKPRWPGAEAGLTQREAEMISLITQGLTNADIARTAYLSPNSVKSYIRAAYRKIGVVRRSQAVIWGMENGMALGRPTQ